MLKLRAGRTYRIYDGKRFTISLDAESHGGVFSPEIHIINRPTPYASRFHNVTIKVPHLSWAFAYSHKRYGLVPIAMWWQRVIRLAFMHPDINARIYRAIYQSDNDRNK